jgi:penicillin V acylase-like amidase (Ntn superfamily)
VFKRKNIAITLIACLTIGLVNTQALACSRVLFNSGDIHVVGRTMDLYIPDHAKLMIYPRGIARDGGVVNSAKWNAKYGSVAVNSLDIATSDGINEKGLVANLLYLHESKYEPRDSRPGVSNAMMVQYLLDNAATVKEALAELTKVQIVSIKAAGREWPLHVSISDASGDSAVFEFVDGKLVVHHGPETVVMTNEPPLDWQLKNLKNYKYFGGKESLPGDIDPASRFVRASAFLRTSPAPKSTQEALAEVFSIVKTVSVPHGAHNTSNATESEDTWPTLWSALADSKNKVYYFSASNSPNMFWVDLNKVNFSKGAPIKFISCEDPALSGEVSSKFIKNK